MDKSIIGNRIKELCRERNMTINALAVKSNVPPSTLKNIVSGNVENTGVETLSKICDGLNISIKDFFDMDELELKKDI